MPERRSWSLTRRMAVLFASTTCILLALHAGWSAYTVVNTVRSDVKAFLDHETAEVAQGLARTDGSPEALGEVLEAIAAVTDDPPCAFRIRDAAGAVVAEGGARRLLRLVPEPIEPGGSWRAHVPGDQVASMAVHEPVHDLLVEVLVDMREHVDSVSDYLVNAGLAFVLTAGGAWLLGAFTARRGLRGLNQVVEQAARIQKAGTGSRIQVDGAPEEVRAVAQALDEMIARIDAGSKRMRTFTAGLAHELRSPIQNLIGETEVALLADRSADEYRAVLGSNLDDLSYLSDAVDNLVAWCRTADPQRVRGPVGPFDLAAEARLRLQREQRAAERVDVALEIHERGDTTLDGEREACLRLVRNLVANAIDWSPAGGTVRLRLTGTDDCVEVCVEDEGPGVSQEFKQRMFEPFVSGPSRRTRRSGYGLGLAIVRSVVDEHGGSIKVEDREGGGARFVVDLPRVAREA